MTRKIIFITIVSLLLFACGKELPPNYISNDEFKAKLLSGDISNLSYALNENGKLKDYFQFLPVGFGKKPVIWALINEIGRVGDDGKKIQPQANSLKWLLEHGAEPIVEYEGNTYSAIARARSKNLDNVLLILSNTGYDDEIQKDKEFVVTHTAKYGTKVDLRDLVSNPSQYQNTNVNPGVLRIFSRNIERGSFRAFRSVSMSNGAIGDEEIEIVYSNTQNPDEWKYLDYAQAKTEIKVIGTFHLYKNGISGYIKANSISLK